MSECCENEKNPKLLNGSENKRVHLNIFLWKLTNQISVLPTAALFELQLKTNLSLKLKWDKTLKLKNFTNIFLSGRNVWTLGCDAALIRLQMLTAGSETIIWLKVFRSVQFLLFNGLSFLRHWINSDPSVTWLRSTEHLWINSHFLRTKTPNIWAAFRSNPTNQSRFY